MRRDNSKDTIWFADAECYSMKYYEEHGRVDEYIVGALNYDTEEEIIAINFAEFLKILENRKESSIVYFHNGFGYDYEFMLPKLFAMYPKENIKTVIDGDGNGFALELKLPYKYKKDGKWKKGAYYIQFRDSYKIFPVALSVLGVAVGYPKLDYGDYDITDVFETVDDYRKHNNGKSYEYFFRDMKIMREFAIQSKHILDIRKYKLTIASTSMNEWKELYPLSNSFKWNLKEKDRVGRWVNNIDVWNEVKLAYKGGITYVKRDEELIKHKDVYVYDINSMYPSIMLNKPLPYGKPSYEDLPEFTYKMYKVKIKHAETDYLPFISTIDYEGVAQLVEDLIEDGESQEMGRGYFREIRNTTINMNNTKLALFEKYYTGEWEVEFLFSFKETKGMFTEYITKFKEIKENSKGAVRLLSKLFLNSLYGKFGMNIRDEVTQIFLLEDIEEELTLKPKTSWLNGKRVSINDNIVKVKVDKGLKRDFSFIPVAERITSYAQEQLVTAINENWEDFIYCDTDSIHLKKPAKGIELDDNEFGKWAFEGKWDYGVYRRAKHYYHLNEDGTYEIKGGGFNVKSANPDNLPLDTYMKTNFTFKDGKLCSETVNGGKLIYTTDYNFTMSSEYMRRKGLNK